MVENQACVDRAYLSQSDSYNNNLKFSTIVQNTIYIIEDQTLSLT